MEDEMVKERSSGMQAGDPDDCIAEKRVKLG